MLGRSIHVEATHGGCAAGRDQYIGIPPEQLPALITAATVPLERQNEKQRAEIASLSQRLGTTEGIVNAVLASLAPHLGDLAPEALPAKVAELVQERQALLEQQRMGADDPDRALAELDRAIADALAAGDDPRAQALLEQKRDLKRAAAAKRHEAAERLREAETRDLLDAAKSEAALGQLALARLDYRAAAGHFRAAADTLPAGGEHRDTRLGYLCDAADALYRQGDELGDNNALAEAMAACRALLSEWTRTRAPLAWAGVQNNLGNALQRLGEREGGTARLEEAVEAYRASLEEYTRERMPLTWAGTQNNLGTALQRLGERESGTARLEEAVIAYRAALEEQTRERVPLAWAMIQNNLGTALQRLGERESGTARLEEAVAVFRVVLDEHTRKRAPRDWAMTQNNLGLALQRLGERESGTARLEEAVIAYRAALEEQTRERVPLAWAHSQHNLAHALEALADRSGDPAFLTEAVASMRRAAEVYREGKVSYWLPVAEASIARMKGKLADAILATDDSNDRLPWIA